MPEPRTRPPRVRAEIPEPILLPGPGCLPPPTTPRSGANPPSLMCTGTRPFSPARCPGAVFARRGRLLPILTKAPQRRAATTGDISEVSPGMSRLCVEAKIPEVGRPRWEARRRSPHLPGEPQAADGGVVQPHDNGVEGQQILVLLAAAGAGGGDEEGMLGRSGI